MYTNFNDFFTVTTRNVPRMKVKLRPPPHLYFATNLPNKTHATAHIVMQHFRNIRNISKFSQNKLVLIL